jgi:hypothetical protein
MAGGDFGDPEVGPAPSPQLAYAAEHAGSDDRDQDMIADHFEAKYNLDPDNPDSDGDGITDGYELINLKTDALAADSDFDAMSDAAEVEAGTNPNMPDNPAAPAALTDEALSDVDGDGIGSLGERLAGTDPRSADSDSDLLADGDEIQLGSDPLDPTSTALVGGVAGDDPLAAVGTDLGGDGVEPAADAVEGG